MVCSCEEAEKIMAKCEECDEFMCIECFKAHCKLKVMKKHKVTVFNSATLSEKKPKVKRRNVKIGVRPKTSKKGVQCNIKPSPTLVTQRALSSNKKCKKFHGISLNLFSQIYSGIRGKFLTSQKLAPKVGG